MSLKNEIIKENYEKRHEESSEDRLVCDNVLNYDIWTIIFKYLSYKDLSNVAMVCRTWSKIAKREKSLRGPELIYFFSSKKYEYGITMKQCIIQSRIKPALGFFFVPYENCFDLKDKDFREIFPKNCKTFIIYAQAVMIHKYQDICISHYDTIGVFFPQMPNTEINYHETLRRGDKYGIDPEYVYMLDRVRYNKISTCIMIFNNCQDHRLGARMYYYTKNRLGTDEKNTILYCDVTMKRVPIHKNKKNLYKPYCNAVSITGSVQTWSIDIDLTHKTHEQIEEELKLFKEQVKLQKHSVGFIFSPSFSNTMFKCDKKGFEFVLRVNFTRFFPKVPLVGCVGTNPSLRNHTFFPQFNTINTNLVDKSSLITFMILTYGSDAEETPLT